MSLPAPNLDDRRFQDLVDDAKRLVQQRCPEWTDHNVSDPGVTLIETVAFMVDQLLYRLNRVPDRNYIKFLELIGTRLVPATAARADLTFWLSAPQQETVTVPARARAASQTAHDRDPVVFSTREPLDIVACQRSRIVVQRANGDEIDHTGRFEVGEAVRCFGEPPQPGDALLIGLSNAVPSCAVLLRLEADIEGVGVDPTNPPLQWEAWVGGRWAPCELDRDTTGGLNRDGDVIVHVDRRHRPSVVAGQRAGWLRARVLAPAAGQPFYSASPRLNGARAETIGGTVAAEHADEVLGEVVGLSEGVPGQRFTLRASPVLDEPDGAKLEVAAGDGWDVWEEVNHFAHSGPDDRHFVVDAVSGEVVFGPALRDRNGSVRQHGALPPKGAPLRMQRYRTGGGRRGNVAAETLSVLKTTIPFVHRVDNRRPAAGGVDGETLEEARVRGAIALRTRDRAVTLEDYEHLARGSAPELSRVRAFRADEPGGVRVLVVPASYDDPLTLEALIPPDHILARVATHLDERRTIGARIVVEPPSYQGVTVVARVRARPTADPQRLERACVAALDRYFHPIVGGPEGGGWPFGRPINAGEVHAVLQRVPGVDFLEDTKVFPADPATGERAGPADRIDLAPTTLAFPYQHQVRVEPALP